MSMIIDLLMHDDLQKAKRELREEFETGMLTADELSESLAEILEMEEARKVELQIEKM